MSNHGWIVQMVEYAFRVTWIARGPRFESEFSPFLFCPFWSCLSSHYLMTIRDLYEPCFELSHTEF